ncbi:MAG: 30S ribosomal protein S17 [Nanoarchaeota archaeon]
MKKNIGINVEVPKKTCNDKNCPFHGSISLRGRRLEGKVIKINLNKGAVIEWHRQIYLSKYERYEKRRSRIHTHKPDCIDLKLGDIVTAVETRPIAKTKSFIIIEVNK